MQVVWSGPPFGRAETCIKTVSVQPFWVQYSAYVPIVEKLETEVVGDEALAKITRSGFPGTAFHIPVPVAARVVALYWQMVWSGPAFGLAVTDTETVSLHVLVVQMYLYVPLTLKFLMVVVGLAGVVMVDVPGFPDRAVHVPVPVPAIVVVPPGSRAQLTVLPGPPLGPMVTCMVSVHPFDIHISLSDPVPLKPIAGVILSYGLVKVIESGLVESESHSLNPPVLCAASATTDLLQTIWSGPALGLAVTTIATVSMQVAVVQAYLYTPTVEKVVIVVDGLVGVVIVDVPGFPARVVHVPVPIAAIVADPPGRGTQLTVLSGPPFGDILTIMVSEHAPTVHISVSMPVPLKPNAVVVLSAELAKLIVS